MTDSTVPEQALSTGPSLGTTPVPSEISVSPVASFIGGGSSSATPTPPASTYTPPTPNQESASRIAGSTSSSNGLAIAIALFIVLFLMTLGYIGYTWYNDQYLVKGDTASASGAMQVGDTPVAENTMDPMAPTTTDVSTGETTSGTTHVQGNYLIAPSNVTLGGDMVSYKDCLARMISEDEAIFQELTHVMWGEKPNRVTLKEIIVNEKYCIGMIQATSPTIKGDFLITEQGGVLLSTLSTVGNDLYYVNSAAPGAANLGEVFAIGREIENGKSTIEDTIYLKILNNIYSTGKTYRIDYTFSSESNAQNDIPKTSNSAIVDSTEPSPTPSISTTPSAPIRQLPPAPTTMTNTPEGVAQYFISSLESCTLRNAFTNTFDEPAMVTTFYEPYNLGYYIELKKRYELKQWSDEPDIEGYLPEELRGSEGSLLQKIQDTEESIREDYQDMKSLAIKVRNKEELDSFDVDDYAEAKQESYERFENSIDTMESVCYAQGTVSETPTLGQVTLSGTNKAKIMVTNNSNTTSLISLQKQSDGQWKITDFTNLTSIKKYIDSIKE